MSQLGATTDPDGNDISGGVVEMKFATSVDDLVFLELRLKGEANARSEFTITAKLEQIERSLQSQLSG